MARPHLRSAQLDPTCHPCFQVASFKREVKMLSSMRHEHIVLFRGACIDIPNLCIVTEVLALPQWTVVARSTVTANCHCCGMSSWILGPLSLGGFDGIRFFATIHQRAHLVLNWLGCFLKPLWPRFGADNSLPLPIQSRSMEMSSGPATEFLLSATPGAEKCPCPPLCPRPLSALMAFSPPLSPPPLGLACS